MFVSFLRYVSLAGFVKKAARRAVLQRIAKGEGRRRAVLKRGRGTQGWAQRPKVPAPNVCGERNSRRRQSCSSVSMHTRTISCFVPLTFLFRRRESLSTRCKLRHSEQKIASVVRRCTFFFFFCFHYFAKNVLVKLFFGVLLESKGAVTLLVYIL